VEEKEGRPSPDFFGKGSHHPEKKKTKKNKKKERKSPIFLKQGGALSRVSFLEASSDNSKKLAKERERESCDPLFTQVGVKKLPNLREPF